MDLSWPEEEGWGYFAGLVDGERSLCLVAETAGEAVGYLVGRMGEDDVEAGGGGGAGEHVRLGGVQGTGGGREAGR